MERENEKKLRCMHNSTYYNTYLKVFSFCLVQCFELAERTEDVLVPWQYECMSWKLNIGYGQTMSFVEWIIQKLGLFIFFLVPAVATAIVVVIAFFWFFFLFFTTVYFTFRALSANICGRFILSVTSSRRFLYNFSRSLGSDQIAKNSFVQGGYVLWKLKAQSASNNKIYVQICEADSDTGHSQTKWHK